MIIILYKLINSSVCIWKFYCVERFFGRWKRLGSDVISTRVRQRVTWGFYKKERLGQAICVLFHSVVGESETHFLLDRWPFLTPHLLSNKKMFSRCLNKISLESSQFLIFSLFLARNNAEVHNIISQICGFCKYANVGLGSLGQERNISI